MITWHPLAVQRAGIDPATTARLSEESEDEQIRLSLHLSYPDELASPSPGNVLHTSVEIRRYAELHRSMYGGKAD